MFAPNVTIDELTRIVSETRLTIVNGPSDAGVYTLAVPAGRDMTAGEALVRLRSDPRVRFAEPVVAHRAVRHEAEAGCPVDDRRDVRGRVREYHGRARHAAAAGSRAQCT